MTKDSWIFFTICGLIFICLGAIGVIGGMVYCQHAAELQERQDSKNYASLTCPFDTNVECRRDFLVTNPHYDVVGIDYASHEEIVYSIKKNNKP